MFKLKSDFRDYYDYAFPNVADRIFDRMANDRSLSKLDQFRLLSSLGLKTPFWAIGKDVLTETPLRLNDLVVVYTDDRAHCGEGKKLISICDMDDLDKAQMCSQWINTTGSCAKAQSYRLLQVGSRAWWLRYEGIGGWMSNHCANTEIFLEGECIDFKRWQNPMLSRYPLFAIDFVLPVHAQVPETIADVFEHGYAIDFNTAPGMRWTGMDEELQPIEVYELISAWLIEQPPQTKYCNRSAKSSRSPVVSSRFSPSFVGTTHPGNSA